MQLSGSNGPFKVIASQADSWSVADFDPNRAAFSLVKIAEENRNQSATISADRAFLCP